MPQGTISKNMQNRKAVLRRKILTYLTQQKAQNEPASYRYMVSFEAGAGVGHVHDYIQELKEERAIKACDGLHEGPSLDTFYMLTK